MGYWNYQIFCNDTALDILDELLEEGNVIEAIECYLDSILSSLDEYIEENKCQYGLVSTVIIDSKINGVDRTLLSDGEWDDYEYYHVIERITLNEAIALKDKAIQVIDRLLMRNCELRELWEENEELYKVWKNHLLKIRYRLFESNDI